MATIRHANRHFLAVLALLSVPLTGLAVDIYVPSLPAVSHFFNVDKTWVQLTITAYLIGLGGMQLFAGSISDSFGRKKPFIVAMMIFILISLLIPASRTIHELLVLRLLQGAAVAGVSVPMRAVISDLYEGKEFYRMVNYITMAWALGPIIAPAIGGYLQYYFDWHAPFYGLVIYSTLVLIVASLALPETSVHRHPFHIKSILVRYKEILSHLDFIAGLTCLGLMYSMVILFGVIGSFMIQADLHYSSIAFGNVALIVGVAWFMGNLSNRLLVKWHVIHKTGTCFSLMLIFSLIMIFVNSYWSVTIYTIMVPLVLLVYVAAIVFPNYFAQTLAIFPHYSASANSLMGALMVILSSVCTVVGAQLKSTSPVVLAVVYSIISLICLLVFFGISMRRHGVLRTTLS